jgi:MftR C-terminal domain
VLLHALHKFGDDNDDSSRRPAELRLRLLRTVPALRGRALRIQLDAQREIARHLAGAFPDQLDQVGAAALTGAFVGAVTGALQVLLDDPAAIQAAVQHATDVTLTPWLQDTTHRPEEELAPLIGDRPVGC